MDCLARESSLHLAVRFSPVLSVKKKKIGSNAPSHSRFENVFCSSEPLSVRVTSQDKEIRTVRTNQARKNRTSLECGQKRRNPDSRKYLSEPTIEGGLKLRLLQEESISLSRKLIVTLPLGFLLCCNSSYAADLISIPSGTENLEIQTVSGFTPEFIATSVGLIFAFWIGNYLAPSLIFKEMMEGKRKEELEEELSVIDLEETKSTDTNSSTNKSKRVPLGFGEAKKKKESQKEL